MMNYSSIKWLLLTLIWHPNPNLNPLLNNLTQELSIEILGILHHKVSSDNIPNENSQPFLLAMKNYLVTLYILTFECLA